MSASPTYFSLAGLTSYAMLATGAMNVPAAGTSLAQAAANTLRENPSAVLDAFRPYHGAENRGALALFHQSVTAPGLARFLSGIPYAHHPLNTMFATAMSPATSVSPAQYLGKLADYLDLAQGQAHNFDRLAAHHKLLLTQLPPQLFDTVTLNRNDRYANISERSIALLFLTHLPPPYEAEDAWANAIAKIRSVESGSLDLENSRDPLSKLLLAYAQPRNGTTSEAYPELFAQLFLDGGYLLGTVRQIAKGKKTPELKRKSIEQLVGSRLKEARLYLKHDAQRAQELYQQALALAQTTGNLNLEASAIREAAYFLDSLTQHQRHSLYEKALDLFRSAGNKFEEANTAILLAMDLEDHLSERDYRAIRELLKSRILRAKAAALFSALHRTHGADRYLNYAEMAAAQRDLPGSIDHKTRRKHPLHLPLAHMFLSTLDQKDRTNGAISLAINYARAETTLTMGSHGTFIANLRAPCVRIFAAQELAQLIASILEIPADQISVSERKLHARTVTLSLAACQILEERYPKRHKRISGAPDSPLPPESQMAPAQP
ncbi:MAG: hypothetical protein COX62_05590 [Deltaproteobacteria bacterium CG_4_10_14_0_2_um_filter_43_8]|nr:MAG: hypothetical protein COV43_05105 [Deltaproteobacteria bacterium CG11_big_fil_rev_8_21_14_0_20_42_23]PJA19956.1 MAG: hypothetical protein COX62_05590 [Deltaproteobacteria bacterium CG_4_10_14_0_2_um_filter_43_8]PJC63608.1 MAG: hypothetical protein CO021_08585 [Deltaproteobacteria bacterium CG_4_9_14_0_2_um_filter_42_21]